MKKAVIMPAELYRKIEERVKGTDFSSVDEHVEFILEEVIKEKEGESAFSEEKVERFRLFGLKKKWK